MRLFAALLFTAIAFSQSVDIAGWADLSWGTAKSIALKRLRPLGAHECHPAAMSCAQAAGDETLVIEKYSFNNFIFTVKLIFTAKNGLSKAIMTAEDKRDAFEKTLSAFTARYGKPGLQSDYDGDDEQTHTTWIWVKAHGKLSLEADETTSLFTVVYEVSH